MKTVLILQIWASCISFSASTPFKSFVRGGDLGLKKQAGDLPEGKRLTLEEMSQTTRKMEYAVRGEVVNEADRINAKLMEKKETSTDDSDDQLPFSEIIYTNIGNPHGVGQRALSWPRQVLALADLPKEMGVDHKDVKKLFPADAIKRARVVKEALGGHGTGAYTNSKGPLEFRKDICRFIEQRDKLEEGACDPNLIFMTNGASSGIEFVLTVLISSPKSGIMIPVPQYPIYSATIDKLDGQKVGYYLDEERGWDMNLEELERSLKEAQENGIIVNSLVLINPGNPTGQVLSKKSIQEILKFCAKHKLVVLADEVYQENIYEDDGEFYSCKRGATELGLIEQDAIELVSFHSTSKGIYGECGRRGGYMELEGIDPEVTDQIVKLASSNLCSNVPGQIMTSLMVNEPKEGDESYESHKKEKAAILESLKKRANIAYEGFNEIPGFSCERAQGAMYCFPSVTLPEKYVDEAKVNGFDADTMYAVSLLKYSGICVVPASGFGQKEGRAGFRTTFLPSEDVMKDVVAAVGKHHEEFCAKYA